MFVSQFICILYFFIVVGFPQTRIDGMAVVVGENFVLHSEILQQAQFVAMEKRVDPSKQPFLFEKIYYETRDNIINQYAVLDIAEKDTNLVISNDEVDRALDQQINDFVSRAGSEKQFLELVGMSMREIKIDYWKDIRNMIIMEKYQFSKIQNVSIGRAEVNRFYNTYKDSLPLLPEQYDFSVIEIPFVAGRDSEEGEVVFLRSLKNDVQNNGVSFDSLAQLYSQDPGSAPSGGYLGYTPRGSLVKEYEEIAYSLMPGDVSDPIQTDFGFHLIKLLDKRGEKISTQHILRTVGFSKEDKNIVFAKINVLYSQTINNPFLFDSLASVYFKKYNNNSGKYINYSKSNIPNYIFSNIELLDRFDVSSPIETDHGYILIYYYNHQKERVPDLENSWNLIHNYAKQKKQTVFFQNWINSIKSKIYIKIINY